MAVWKIEEDESFFLDKLSIPVPVSHPVKRLQHLAGRYLLSYLFPDFQVNKIVISNSLKPILPDHSYHFSISHCDNYAAAIVSKTMNVGIDVETVTERVLRIQHKFLNDEELNSLLDLNKTELMNQLTVLWGAKEAMYKWWGKGDVDFREVLQTQPFELSQAGILTAKFCKKSVPQLLSLNYKLTNTGLSIVWLASELA